MKKIPYEINQKGEKGTKKFCGHFKFLLKSTKKTTFSRVTQLLHESCFYVVQFETVMKRGVANFFKSDLAICI